jgi:hypothetical protein
MPFPGSPCSFPECSRGTRTDYCVVHRKQLKSSGTLAPIAEYMPRGLSPKEAVEWCAVVNPDGCWGWRGAKNNRGYATIPMGKRRALASRVQCELAYGPIPDGAVVCHRCDNPECVRLDHLFIGTRADNNRDRATKGRSAIGERAGRAVLTDDRVRWIRTNKDRISAREMARRLCASRGAVDAVIYGDSWKHVNNEGPIWGEE